MAYSDDFRWSGSSVREVLCRLGYEKFEGSGWNENFEVWMLDGDEETDVQIPLKEEASDYQFLCDACINQIMRQSLTSVESMYKVSKTLISVKYPGI